MEQVQTLPSAETTPQPPKKQWVKPELHEEKVEITRGHLLNPLAIPPSGSS